MAAFSGKNSDEWSGPKNPLGQADFHIYQNNKPVGSLSQAFASGNDFTVVWYFEPSDKEIDAGITTRRGIAEVFGASDSYIGILGTMYALRRATLTLGVFDSGPAVRINDF